MIVTNPYVPNWGPRARNGTKLFAALLKQPYERLLDERLPERLARLVEQLDAPGSTATSSSR
jgi:hypothetical protein